MKYTIVQKTHLSWTMAKKVWTDGVFKQHIGSPERYILPLIKRLIKLLYARHPELVHEAFTYARMYALKYHKNYVLTGRYGGYKVDLLPPIDTNEETQDDD